MAKNKTATDKAATAFRAKLEKIMGNLMRITGIRTATDLGKWLKKSDDRNAVMYFTQAKYHCFLDYEMVVNRCLEEGFDLNEVFGEGRGADYKTLSSRYGILEKQVKELITQNGMLLEENKTISAAMRDLSAKSHELVMKHMEMINQPKSGK